MCLMIVCIAMVHSCSPANVPNVVVFARLYVKCCFACYVPHVTGFVW